jgi:hypothetical protein
MPVHPDGESNDGVYSTSIFNFCCITIRCNNALLRLIVPCQNKNQRTLNPIQLRFLNSTNMLLQKFSCRDKKVTCAILITTHKHRRQRKKHRVEHNQSDNNRLQKNIIAKIAYILLNIKNSLHEKKYYSTKGYA